MALASVNFRLTVCSRALALTFSYPASSATGSFCLISSGSSARPRVALTVLSSASESLATARVVGDWNTGLSRFDAAETPVAASPNPAPAPPASAKASGLSAYSGTDAMLMAESRTTSPSKPAAIGERLMTFAAATPFAPSLGRTLVAPFTAALPSPTAIPGINIRSSSAPMRVPESMKLIAASILDLYASS